MDSEEKLEIGLRQMIIAIEMAVSLVGMNDTNHGKRVGYIASQIARQLGSSEDDVQFAFELGMLHDCGVSTQQMHESLVNNFDWDDAHIHCEIGYRLLRDFEPLAKYARPVLYHHTAWEKLNALDLSPNERRMANLVYLSDRIDVLALGHYDRDILLARNEIVQSIEKYSASYFEPGLVDAFMALQTSEAFWIVLEDRHIVRFTWDMGQVQNNSWLSWSQIKQLSLIMSYIVDQKSSFTAQHSVRVAELAKFLAARFGLSAAQCEKIEIAGLLHDLGKLHTPDKILEKPGPLDEVERSIMNQHSYETFEILRHIKGLHEVAQWAAYHHEGINGAGYPFHPGARELSSEARILAVADVFQALVQDRPYRKGMSLEQVMGIIEDMAEQGKLDRKIVKLAREHGAESYAIARGEGEENRIPQLKSLIWDSEERAGIKL